LRLITNIYLSKFGQYPSDAPTLAANDLDVLEKAAKSAAAASGIDTMTHAHFKEVLRQIEAAKSAMKVYRG